MNTGISVILVLLAITVQLASSIATIDSNNLRPAVALASEGKSHVYYLGVGSNLLKSKLINRGLNSTKINIESFEPAYVQDYRLAFNLKGFPPIEPVMGGIEPCIGTQCHGALAKVTLDEYEKIWRSEGGGRPKPGYEEVVVDAIPYGSKTPVKAIALRAANHTRLSIDGAPSKRYMGIILEGAKELGLRSDYINKLENIKTNEVSSYVQTLCRYQFIFFGILSKLPFKKKTNQGFSPIVRMMSNIMWKLWVPPTYSRFRRYFSEFLMSLVLLPGAGIGLLVKCIYTIQGKPIPGIFGAPSSPNKKPLTTTTTAATTQATT